MTGEQRRPLRLPRALVPAGLGVLALPAAAWPQVAVTDDASVARTPEPGGESVRHGRRPSLVLSPTSDVYLRFAVPPVPPAAAGAAVARATLKLFVTAAHGGTIDIYRVDGDWTEDTLAPDQLPPLGDRLAAGVLLQEGDQNRFLSLDVTEAVRQWLGEDGSGTGAVPNHGLALVSAGAQALFDSKENRKTSHEPRLDVEITGPTSGGTVTRVSADGPITVTDATSSPHLALGIVPAALGGTGLGSAGVAGSFLRSNGAGWTSAPLGAPDVPAGSDHYIRNGGAPQPAGFSITGRAQAAILDALTHFSLGGQRVLSNFGTDNTLVGVGAGANTGFSARNTFVGRGAGEFNVTHSDNTFVGAFAGRTARSNANSFFGAAAGGSTTTGSSNSFFGAAAGRDHTSASGNAFFGASAGLQATTGGSNTLVGTGAGSNLTTGSQNVFIGSLAGNPNVATQVSNSVAIGSGATVSASNTIVLGSSGHTTRLPGRGVIMGGGGTYSAQGGGDFETFNAGFVEGIFTGTAVFYQLNALNTSRVHVCATSLQVGGGLGGLALTLCTPSAAADGAESGAHPEEHVERLDAHERALQALEDRVAGYERQVEALAALLCRTSPRAEPCRGR